MQKYIKQLKPSSNLVRSSHKLRQNEERKIIKYEKRRLSKHKHKKNVR